MSNNISVDKAIEIGVQAGVKEALDRIEKAKNDKTKYKHDRRLRNTKLLLRNYNNFKAHCKNAVYTSEQLGINVIDVLDEYNNIDDDTLYINSIKKTQARTYIIVKHINRIMQYYKFSAEKSNDENVLRRYNAIKIFYLDNDKKSYDEVAEILNVSERTIFRDIKQAIEELSVLIFGVDGMKLEAD